MTYHDGNRAAKFRSSRLGAAVEQITGKRTELSLYGNNNSTKTKQKKPRIIKEKDVKDLLSPPKSVPLKSKAVSKRKIKGVNKCDDLIEESVTVIGCMSSSNSTTEHDLPTQPTVTTALAITLTSTPILASTSTSASASQAVVKDIDVSNSVENDKDSDSDFDVFDDDYKKRKGSQSKSRNKNKR